jgi:predicted cupin superfamily sugar epimerase
MPATVPEGEARAAELVRLLKMRPHPEGGHYAEVFRSARSVQPGDGRPMRPGLTTIDFLLTPGQFSAWHRVSSDEVWHLLEGAALRLWLAPPDLSVFTSVDLAPVSANSTPRHVVPAGWWQAAEPLRDFAYVGATVGPGFDFADFTFGRKDAALKSALAAQAPPLQRLL